MLRQVVLRQIVRQILRVAHMRTVCWGQVSDHSQHPESWNELEVDDAADKSEVQNQVVEDGSFADPPELRLLSDRAAWRKWEKLESLPSGDLTIKVICRKAGQSGALLFIEQGASWHLDKSRALGGILKAVLKPAGILPFKLLCLQAALSVSRRQQTPSLQVSCAVMCYFYIIHYTHLANQHTQ